MIYDTFQLACLGQKGNDQHIGIYGGIYIKIGTSLGMMVWLGWDADGNYIWTQRGYMYRESLALLSTQYVGTYLGMMVWLGWDGNDPAAASSLSFPHMPTTLPIYRQVTLQKHTIMKYGVQISEFRIREIPLSIYRRLVSLQKHRINENVLTHDKYEIWSSQP